MAVRESVTPTGAGARRTWFVAACLVVLFIAALFLRAYWNLDAANPGPGEFILSGGSDPYYHKRAVDAIQDNDFKHYLSDPLLNYPVGSENPNPPLYQWSIAVSGKLIEPFFDPVTAADGTTLSALDVATWQATIWSPAIFGALTIFPIYFIAAALFDRRAGLIAALLWTVSTSAVDAGGVGLADHDAAVLFFVSLSFLFYIQTIRQFRGDGNWVANWGAGGIGAGLGRLFRERRLGFAYAFLTAFSIAGVALIWKGFNYVIGIILVYAVIQMVIDHWRNRDSTGLFLATLVAVAGGIVIALPYYTTAAVGSFLQPTWFMIASLAIAGLVLVPTRDLPALLVLPLAAVAAIVLGLTAFFVFPVVAQSLLFATVYFKQTRLYETIAEAHGADFSTIMFGIGPVAFFLALAGWLVLYFRLHATGVSAWTRIALGALAIAVGALTYRLLGLVGSSAADAIGLIVFGLLALSGLAILFAGEHPEARTWIFVLIWAAVAYFMATSAVRFLINAIPAFAVVGAFMIVWVLDWLDFGAIRKSLAANRGNFWGGFRRGVRPLHVVAVLLIALLFVLPTTILAADAALPPEAEQKLATDTDSEFVRNFFNERMGAYGQGFGQVKPWIPPFEFLKARDADIADPASRPAFLAWWDYGHWAIAISEHPAVADNFQNGYEFAANFILSQDEAGSIQLLAARTAEAPGADLEKALGEVGSANVAEDAKAIRAWQKVNLSVQQSADLLAKVESQTGKSIRYFATDIRMLPYDNPQSQNIEAASIFYAPVTLKGDEPNDYVTTQVNMGQAVPGAPDGYVTVERYEELASDPVRQYRPAGERFVYQQKFLDSAYYRHYVGTPVASSGSEPILGTNLETALNNPRPAYGLEHFRAVYVGNITRLYRGGDPADFSSYVYYPEIVITEYYSGAVVTGTVTENGQPVPGVRVTAFDDVGTLIAERYGSGVTAAEFNVPHATTITAADGTFRLLAPFAMPGGNVSIVAERDGVVLGEAPLAITREDAATGRAFTDVAIAVTPGSVEGIAFMDADADGVYNATKGDTLANDTPIAIGGQSVTTDAEGKYRVDGVPAGTQTVTSETPALSVVAASSRVRVNPGGNVTHNVGLQAAPARVTGQLVADLDANGAIGDGETVAFETLDFTADATIEGNTARTVAGIITDTGGNFTAQLAPGTYNVTATYTDTATGDTYELSEQLIVAAGEVRTGVELRLTKTTA